PTRRDRTETRRAAPPESRRPSRPTLSNGPWSLGQGTRAPRRREAETPRRSARETRSERSLLTQFPSPVASRFAPRKGGTLSTAPPLQPPCPARNVGSAR